MREDINVQFGNCYTSWSYDPTWTVDELARDFRSLLQLNFIPKIGLYGSILPSDSDFSDWIIESDTITPLHANGVDKIQLPANFFDTQDPPRGQFHIFTTYSYDSLTNGFIQPIDIHADFENARNQIINSIKQQYNISNSNINALIYLPGGIPYVKGTISDFYNTFDKAKHLIFVVVFDSSRNSRLTQMGSYIEFLFTPRQLGFSKSNSFILSPLLPLNGDSLDYGCMTFGMLEAISRNQLSNLIGWLEDKMRFSAVFTSLFDIQHTSTIYNHNIMTISAVLLCIAQEICRISNGNINDLWPIVFNLLGFIDDSSSSSSGNMTTKYAPFLSTVPSEAYFKNALPDLGHITYYEHDFSQSYGIKNKDALPGVDVIRANHSVSFSMKIRISDILHIPTTVVYQGPTGPVLSRGPVRTAQANSDKPKLEYVILRPDKDKEEIIDLEEEAKSIRNQVEIATPADIKQINIVCCDTSGSMYGSRLKIAKKAFKILAKRAFYVGPQTLWGLIKFDDKVEVIQNITSITAEFYTSLKNLHANGCTALYESCKTAMNIMPTNYPNAQKRIVLLTDGGDNMWWGRDNDKVKLINDLIANNIHVDLIEVSSECEVGPRNLAVMTGGGYFKAIDDDRYLKRLFESDGFFNLELRQFSPTQRAQSTNALNTPRSPISKPVLKDFETMLSLNNMETVKAAIKRLNDLDQISAIQNKVRQQLKDIASQLPAAPFMKVLVKKDDCTKWSVWLKGKRKSQFNGKWFKLIVMIPNSYPVCPPEIRFIQSPSHPQITPDGSIGMDALRSRFNPNMSIYFLLHSIRTLLANPTYTNIFNVDFEGSTRPPSCNFSAPLPADYYFNDSNISVKIDCNMTVPAKYCDPLNFSVMKKPVRASNGLYFDRDSLEKAFAKLQSIVDPRDGRTLYKNQNSNLQIDNQFLDKIQNYMRKHNVH